MAYINTDDFLELFAIVSAGQDEQFINTVNKTTEECIYLKNRDKQKYFEYSTSEHERILQFDLEKYRISPEETIIKEFNDNRNKRVAGIRKTQDLVNKNYEEWKKKK